MKRGANVLVFAYPGEENASYTQEELAAALVAAISALKKEIIDLVGEEEAKKYLMKPN